MNKQFSNAYWRVGVVIAILVLGYGVFAPMLVNDAEADILVGAGYVLTYAIPFFCIWVLVPIFKHKND